MRRLFIWFVFLICSITTFSSYSQKLIQIRTAIQISSTISDGKYSLFQIAKIAKDNGIKAVVFTDKGFMRWEYGLWPLRCLIKKTVISNSIVQYKPQRYLKDIADLESQFPHMVFISGVDSSPFYYWRGSFISGDLTICNWHKQLIAIGLNKPSDYINLPVIGNPKALRDGIEIFKLWPFVTLSIGLLLFKRRIYSYKDIHGKELAPYSKGSRIKGSLIIVLSILFILNNWPPFKVKFDAYHGDLKSAPYQNFIDYVNRIGGLVFWTHPEAENISQRGKVKIETKKYPQELLYTKGYTGFTVFPAGYKEIGKPKGIWDTLLKEYCSGKRKRPVWAIGTLSFDQQGELSKRISAVSTVLLVNKLTKKEIIKSLKKGRMYTLKGEETLKFILDEFSVVDKKTNRKATLGETIVLENNLFVRIKGHFIENDSSSFEIKLIRDGRVIKRFKEKNFFDISYEDVLKKRENSYYRLEIRSQGLIVITNPIFVSFK